MTRTARAGQRGRGGTGQPDPTPGRCCRHSRRPGSEMFSFYINLEVSLACSGPTNLYSLIESHDRFMQFVESPKKGVKYFEHHNIKEADEKYELFLTDRSPDDKQDSRQHS